MCALTEDEHEHSLFCCPMCGEDAAYPERYGTPRASCICVCDNCGLRLESNEQLFGKAWNTRAVGYKAAGYDKLFEITASVQQGDVEVEVQSDPRITQYIAQQLAGLLYGPNYTEMIMSPTPGVLIDGKYEKIVITIQKVNGLTPGNLKSQFETALRNLVHQVQLSNARDDDGHALADLQALHEANELLADHPKVELPYRSPSCPYCTAVMTQAQHEMGVMWLCACKEVHP